MFSCFFPSPFFQGGALQRLCSLLGCVSAFCCHTCLQSSSSLSALSLHTLLFTGMNCCPQSSAGFQSSVHISEKLAELFLSSVLSRFRNLLCLSRIDTESLSWLWNRSSLSDCWKEPTLNVRHCCEDGWTLSQHLCLGYNSVPLHLD